MQLRIAFIDDHSSGTGIYSYHRSLYENAKKHGINASFYHFDWDSSKRIKYALSMIKGENWKSYINLQEDILHVSNPNLAGLCRYKTSIVTVHDLYYMKGRSRSLLWSIYCRYNYRYIGECKYIIANSYSTMKELQELMKLDASSISVVYPSPDDAFSPQGERVELWKGKKVILHVGYDTPNKNIVTLVEALRRLPEEFVLLRVGYTSDDTINKIRRMNIADRVKFLDHIDLQDLAKVYRSSYVFVFPSIYEGFGIPPLEAMASGLPVVSSLAAGLKESCGDASIAVDPFSPEDIADAILSLDQPDRYSRQSRIGLRHAERFSKEEQFKQLVSAYRSFGFQIDQ